MGKQGYFCVVFFNVYTHNNVIWKCSQMPRLNPAECYGSSSGDALHINTAAWKLRKVLILTCVLGYRFSGRESELFWKCDLRFTNGRRAVKNLLCIT